MALPSSSPVPIEADTGAGYGADPVSSGPYAITSVDPATGILLDRNPHWDPATDDGPHRAARPGRRPHRAGRRGARPGAAGRLGRRRHLRHRRPGRHDRAARRGRGRPRAGPGGRRDHRRRPAARAAHRRRPDGQPGCRAAVAAAIDRRGVQEQLGGAVNAVRSSQLWPRALDGGPEDADPRPDLAAARAALEACGQPDGFATVLAVADTPSSVDVAEEIAGQLAEVGIEVEVRPLRRDHVLRHRRRQPGQRRGQRLRHRPGHLDGGLPDARRRSWRRWSTAAASARSATPTTRGSNDPAINALIDQARAAGRETPPPGARSPTPRGHRCLRAAGRDPRAAGRRAAAAQRRGDAAVQRLRPRHRRRASTEASPEPASVAGRGAPPDRRALEKS